MVDGTHPADMQAFHQLFDLGRPLSLPRHRPCPETVRTIHARQAQDRLGRLWLANWWIDRIGIETCVRQPFRSVATARGQCTGHGLIAISRRPIVRSVAAVVVQRTLVWRARGAGSGRSVNAPPEIAMTQGRSASTLRTVRGPTAEEWRVVRVARVNVLLMGSDGRRRRSSTRSGPISANQLRCGTRPPAWSSCQLASRGR